MRSVFLKRIVLSNWKAKNLDVEFTKKETRISAKNEVGKSSLQQAWNWVFTSLTTPTVVKNHELFDNRVPLSPDTPEASVKIWIDIDGDEYVIERIAKAKFTRPRGQVEYVKSSSDEYIVKLDGVEMSATDFEGWVSAMICPIDMLPFVLDGAFFTTLAIDNKMKARAILESIVSDVDFSHFGSEYDDLKEALNKFSLAQLKEQAMADIKPSKRRLDEIPTIIKSKTEFIKTYDLPQSEINQKYAELARFIADCEGKVAEKNMFLTLMELHSFVVSQMIVDKEKSNIEHLKDEQRKEAIALAKKEGRKAKIDALIEEVADKVSKDINLMLGDYRIVMFDTLRNGDKVPNCIVTDVNGVKFATLSNSARLRANLAIQDMFRRKFGVNMITWVDESSVFDAEHLPRPDGQVCYLFAGESNTLIVQ